ncbi:RNA polymerase I-specific transcription initiation factor-domain-containing protein, partial [Usnea florida]
DDPPANQAAADGEPQHSQDPTSLPSRPNKFLGPPSTWRNWTAPERDLAASVEQLQAKDLSIHLYNSFKLRHRYRLRSPDRQVQSPQDSKSNEGSQWVPPKVWTAWPLPPDIVPREHDERRWENDDTPSERHHARLERPGQHLQEMLVAQVLRKAKEQFGEQEWEGEKHPTKITMRYPEHLQSRRRANGRFRAKQDHDIPDQKPVIMADDQRASEILRPTVQHMMTKLDGLLMGLHHARAAYLTVEDSDSESRSLINKRATSRGRPRKRKQKASSPDEDTGTSQDMPDYDGSDSGGSQSRKKKPSRKGRMQYARSSSGRSWNHDFRGRKGRLGLRDWGDVLGIASMIGWQQSVVGSATARCATLFEEGIKFRTLEE